MNGGRAPTASPLPLLELPLLNISHQWSAIVTTVYIILLKAILITLIRTYISLALYSNIVDLFANIFPRVCLQKVGQHLLANKSWQSFVGRVSCVKVKKLRFDSLTQVESVCAAEVFGRASSATLRMI